MSFLSLFLGEKKKTAIASVLTMNPEVWTMDEPLSALDYKLRKAMQLELKQLQRRLGITFIFVTHDQEEALSMSDRVHPHLPGRLPGAFGTSDAVMQCSSAPRQPASVCESATATSSMRAV